MSRRVEHTPTTVVCLVVSLWQRVVVGYAVNRGVITFSGDKRTAIFKVVVWNSEDVTSAMIYHDCGHRYSGAITVI